MLVILTVADDERFGMLIFFGWNWAHEGKLVQVIIHGFSGNSCLSLSSISYFVKLEMFAIADR